MIIASDEQRDKWMARYATVRKHLDAAKAEIDEYIDRIEDLEKKNASWRRHTRKPRLKIKC